jgi:signal peptidase II
MRLSVAGDDTREWGRLLVGFRGMRRLGWLGFLLLSGAVTGCDHVTKHVAATQLGAAGRTIVPGVLDLVRVGNTDTAFSLIGDLLPMHTRIQILTVLTCVFVVVLCAVVAVRWRRASVLERLAGALLLGGALGNTIDRLVRGHVIDWIHVHHWPAFNVADIALTVGVGLLLLESWTSKAARATGSATP